jgi:hypothetical protein
VSVRKKLTASVHLCFGGDWTYYPHGHSLSWNAYNALAGHQNDQKHGRVAISQEEEFHDNIELSYIPAWHTPKTLEPQALRGFR